MSSSLTTTDDDDEVVEIMPPLHPGEMLREEFMVPLNLSANVLAKALRVPVSQIDRLLREKSLISVDLALRLSRYFRIEPEFWINLNAHYEKDVARRADLSIYELIEPSRHREAAE